jgi:hypothetical protein
VSRRETIRGSDDAASAAGNVPKRDHPEIGRRGMCGSEVMRKRYIDTEIKEIEERYEEILIHK